MDQPLPIGFNATISAPHIHARVLDIIDKYMDSSFPLKILDIGSGSGYLTVAIAHLIGSTGKVIGLDHIQELVDFANRNTSKNFDHYIKEGRVSFICADGRTGYTPEAPYDFITVGAQCDEIPIDLLNQLKVGGIMIIPVGFPVTYFKIVKKVNNYGDIVNLEDQAIVAFVPLTDKEKQLKMKILN